MFIPALGCLVVWVVTKYISLDIASLVAVLVLPLFIIIFYLIYPRLLPLYAIGIAPILIIPLVVQVKNPNVYKSRNFYGVLKVQKRDQSLVIISGTTLHGMQYKKPSLSHEATAYYNQKGPVGDIVKLCRDRTGCHQMASIGLGAGTLAAYGEAGDKITFYEIDPADIRIAQDLHYFTYIKDSKAKVGMVEGDGRLKLAKTSNKYDLLMVDAYPLTLGHLKQSIKNTPAHGYSTYDVKERVQRLLGASNAYKSLYACYSR